MVAVLLTLAAAFAYLNHRFLRLPPTIAMTGMSLALALALAGLGALGLDVSSEVREFLDQVDFSKFLLEGILGLLLFAGALHVDLNDLAEHKWSVGAFATIGVVGSTAIVGTLTCGISSALGLGLAPVHCFLFGALISPTDPISVLAILRKIGAPKSLEVRVAGESLFNDGIGVVVFLTILSAAGKGTHDGLAEAAILLGQEAFGGIALGLLAGWAAYRLIKSIDNYQAEILLTLALVTGSYALAGAIHVSGPLATVAAGLLIGNKGRRLAMSQSTRNRLDSFWALIDEIFNAMLFVLIGLEALVLSLRGQLLLAGLLAIPAVLFARLVAIGIPVKLLSTFRPFAPKAVRTIAWAGLRGGISVALALSLPASAEWTGPREAILNMTYLVVVFSILVQGMTIGRFVQTSEPPDLKTQEQRQRPS